MSKPKDQAPDQAVAPDDPGDETSRRYRFQWTWAATVCCMLFDNTRDVIEIFCEQHEDVLLKHRDGKFTGHQAKTRESSQRAWKANDQQVVSAFARFARLEVAHPEHFRAFRFLTSHPLHAANNAQSLPYALSQIEGAPNVAGIPSGVADWLRRVANDAKVPEATAFHALKKATASDDLSKLQDSTMRLIKTLTECWPGAADCSVKSVERAAKALVEECGRASALDHEQTLPGYISAINQPDAQVATRIEGKRMTKNRVQTVLREALAETAILSGPPDTRIKPGHGSTALMLTKLEAGGFSPVSCNSAEDLRDKADFLGITWTKKHGRSKGLERYEHVRSMALSDSSRAFEATKQEGQRFGPAMREYLRRRFQERRSDGDQLFDCSNEHLEGFAYSLTAQCKVQWSTDRPWEVT